MTAIEKIIMVDRVYEKFTDEEMKKLKEDYAQYCLATYKYVQDLGIPNKEAKDVVFNHMLSPFQYYLEDRVRMLREREGKLTPPQTPYQGPTSRGPTNGAQAAYKPKWKKY